MQRPFPSIDQLKASIGQKIGTSEWLRIDQERLNRFADVTDDHDPMHVDPEWAIKHSPYAGTICFGFLTLSLLTRFSHEILRWPTSSDGNGYALNYGFDRVRFLAPVRVGSRIRCHMTLLKAQERGVGRILVKYGIEIEIENESRPALTAEWLGLRVSDGNSGPGDPLQASRGKRLQRA